MDEWQRWANAGVQEELCQRVEALMQVDDLAVGRPAAARGAGAVEAGGERAARAVAGAVDAVQGGLATPCARAATSTSRSWRRSRRRTGRARSRSASGRGAVRVERLDQDGRRHQGAAGRVEDRGAGAAAQEKALWDRFHAACDGFFTRRRNDLQQRKQEWAANLARKEAICAQAEAIAETTEWQKGIEEIKRLQAEWKTIGPVRKTRADEVWLRFRAACDKFFEAYQNREQPRRPPRSPRPRRSARRSRRCCRRRRRRPKRRLPAPEGLGEKVADIRRRWAEKIAGLPRDRAIRLGERFTHALARARGAVAGQLRRHRHRPRGERPPPRGTVRADRAVAGARTRRVAAAASEPADDDSPATLLARQLREALATNTIAGRQDESAKWKAASEQVRAAQAAWKKIGPVPEGAGRALNARFQRACAQGRPSRSTSSGAAGVASRRWSERRAAPTATTSGRGSCAADVARRAGSSASASGRPRARCPRRGCRRRHAARHSASIRVPPRRATPTSTRLPHQVEPRQQDPADRHEDTAQHHHEARVAVEPGSREQAERGADQARGPDGQPGRRLAARGCAAPATTCRC